MIFVNGMMFLYFLLANLTLRQCYAYKLLYHEFDTMQNYIGLQACVFRINNNNLVLCTFFFTPGNSGWLLNSNQSSDLSSLTCLPHGHVRGLFVCTCIECIYGALRPVDNYDHFEHIYMNKASTGIWKKEKDQMGNNNNGEMECPQQVIAKFVPPYQMTGLKNMGCSGPPIPRVSQEE